MNMPTDGDDVLSLGDDGGTLEGMGGNDTLTGGAGNDTLDGGPGNDRMTGKGGDDIYVVDSPGDKVIEEDDEGTDTVRTSLATYALGAHVENLVYTLGAPTILTGNALANVIVGGTGENRIWGGGGNDTLFGGDFHDQLDGSTGDDTLYGFGGGDILIGGAGNDTLVGGKGDDIYIVDTGDIIAELEGGGIDAVATETDFTLTPGQEIERLQARYLNTTYALNLTGNDFNNIILGNAGSNVIDGGGGADTMRGGLGDDTYVVDNGNDDVYDTGGSDTVLVSLNQYSPITLTGIETVTFTGVGNTRINLNYAFGVQLLTGGSGNDNLSGAAHIVGGDGNDTILSIKIAEGGQGNDVLSGFGTLMGGAGDDTYTPSNDGAYGIGKMIEAPGEGFDTYLGAGKVALLPGQSIEQMIVPDTYSGYDGIADFTGNELANTLIGGSGNDKLNGGGGNDLLIGKAGFDQLTGGAGADTFRYNDQFDFARYKDIYYNGSTPPSGNAPVETIADFSHAQGDKIDLHQVAQQNGFTYEDLTFTSESDGNTLISIPGYAFDSLTTFYLKVHSDVPLTHDDFIL